MKDIFILGIETSCDETSVAIVKNGNEVVSLTILSQIDIHKNFGGVVPEVASRLHLENITMVLEDTLAKAKMEMNEIDAIAVTFAPGLLGSLLIGVECAKTLAFIYNKPLIKVNHLVGHIYANNLIKPMVFPALALIVSGGHTSLLTMEEDYKFKLLGETLDDALGEAYDKIARILGCPYPGGPEVEKLALNGENTYELPKVMKDDSYNFSYSGLKSSVMNLVKKEGNALRKNDLAKSFQIVAVDQIKRKVEKAFKEQKIYNFVLAGGVSANKYLREELKTLCNKYNIIFSCPEFIYSTDNAAMIASAAYPLFKAKKFENLALNASSNDISFHD